MSDYGLRVTATYVYEWWPFIIMMEQKILCICVLYGMCIHIGVEASRGRIKKKEKKHGENVFGHEWKLMVFFI